jgi:hypothetical protein
MIDIYIVFAETDWSRVLPLARHLAAYGYTVGPSKALDLPNKPAVEPTEADAKCVIVVWSRTSTTSAALHYAARTAVSRKALVEIRTAKNVQGERYLPYMPIDFSTWDHTTREGAWRLLLRRLRPICGAPPKRPLDLVEVGPRALMAGVAVVSIGTSALILSQSNQSDARAASEAAEAVEIVPPASSPLPAATIAAPTSSTPAEAQKFEAAPSSLVRRGDAEAKAVEVARPQPTLPKPPLEPLDKDAPPMIPDGSVGPEI